MRHLFRWGLPALLLVMISSIVWAVPPQQESPDNLFQAFLIDLRADMELLADRVFGGGTRPDAWTGNTDFRSDNMLADLWFDSEVVANEIYGEGLRPRDWIGASTRNADLVSRNVRHDLELLGN